MKIIHLNKNFTLEKKFQKIPLIIGNFDGIHFGHKSLFDKVIHQKFNVLTFDNIPRKQTQCLYSLSERLDQISHFFPKNIFVLDLRKNNCTAKEFEKRYLSVIDPGIIIIGSDFKFGSDFISYKSLALKYEISLVKYDSNYSSTKVRDDLKTGLIEKANSILITNYYRIGKVHPGKKNGKNLGYPTANLYFDDKYVQLKSGSYISSTQYNGVNYRSLTFVGKSKTFADKSLPAIETHILENFHQDLYDSDIKITFLKFIRPNRKFNNEPELISAIKSDIDFARRFILF